MGRTASRNSQGSCIPERSRSSLKSKYMPRKIPLQVLAELESGIQHLSDKPIHMSKTNGVLLGALKPVHFLHEMYKNAIMTHTF